MEKLIQGIHQFQNSYFQSQQDLFEQLASGQKPQALFITCSDSRISPSLLTQSKPGDLFSLRNAGNIVPPYGASRGGEEATIEYAIRALGVGHIIVCGHSHCGAMKALLHPKDVEEMPAVINWLSNAEATRRIIKENYSHLDDEAKLKAAVEENVLVQIENLRTHPSVAAKLSKRELVLYAWVYKIETGQVFSYDPEQEQFSSVTESKEFDSSTKTQQLAVAGD
jgi:carbonic anhydrase